MIKDRSDYFEMGDGWNNLVNEFLDFCEEQDYEVIISQIKEKFGGLRIYYCPSTVELERKEDEVVGRASTTCEVCGEVGIFRGDLGWVRTLCEKDYLRIKK